MNHLARYILQIFFPATCLVCGDDLPFESDQPVCVACTMKIDWLQRWEMFSFQPIDGLYSASQFEGPMRELVHHFKYKGRDYLSKLLAEFMLRKNPFETRDFECVTFVPMDYLKKIKRGYNQSELLAEKIAEKLNKKLVRPLKRRKFFSKSQTSLDRNKRFQNASSAFSVGKNRSQIKNKTVLLIDDVATTGATMFGCAKAMKEAGAKKVYGLVLAREMLQNQVKVQ